MMMKLFAKRKESSAKPTHNAISKGIQAGCKRVQGSWANWITERTKKFSRRTWLLLLTLFVLSGSAYSIYVAFNAVTGNGGSSITITPIKKPKYTTKTVEATTDPNRVSEAGYNRLKKFRAYMDSLARSPSAKAVCDSVKHHRPGLMDSVRFLENYYQQLNRNK